MICHILCGQVLSHVSVHQAKRWRKKKVLRNDWSIIKQLLFPLFCCNLPQMMSHFYEHWHVKTYFTVRKLWFTSSTRLFYFNCRKFTSCLVWLVVTRVSLLPSWPSPRLSPDSDIVTDSFTKRSAVSRTLIIQEISPVSLNPFLTL